MRLVEINAVPTGSTGGIMLGIAKILTDESGSAKTFYTPIYTQKKIRNYKFNKLHHKVGSHFENTVHAVLGQLTGLNGMFSYFGTRRLIKEIKKFNPDVIHLHVLHAFCFCLPLLFKYIKNANIPTVWTFHDCWAFTGHCPHFDMVKCDKWKTGCGHCPQLSCYPKTRLDTTALNFKLKKKWFTGIENMTIVTPSQWLSDLVKQSFLSEYPIRVINNGIDLNVFKPTENDFRDKYHIQSSKKILLGVSSGWGKRKGLDVFVELSKRLDSEKYQIVLVGTDDACDVNLPKDIISIHRTSNQTELAEIYTAADLFINPTREDTYPTVNMEALACGTPILTFTTGGSSEIINSFSGLAVPCNDIDALENGIYKICNNMLYSSQDCINKSKEFDMYDKFKEYIELYEEIKS